jgi:hypothetical protein
VEAPVDALELEGVQRAGGLRQDAEAGPGDSDEGQQEQAPARTGHG